MKMDRLTLREALAEGRLADFIDQAEADGIGPSDREQFEAIVKRVVTAPPPSDRTSRSPARGGSRGK